MSDPQTAAGRRLLREWPDTNLPGAGLSYAIAVKVIPEIEAEAALLARRAPGDRGLIRDLFTALRWHAASNHNIAVGLHSGNFDACSNERCIAVRELLRLAADSRPDHD